MYITLMPVILAGISNMLFTRTPFYKKYALSMDGGHCMKDGRRIFGDNKTWAGFWGMAAAGIFMQLFWGWINRLPFFAGRNELYQFYDNTALFNILAGFMFGFAYVLFELPNSFVKRRLNITPGRTGRGLKGFIFFIADQIDSLVGVVLVLNIFSPMGWGKYLLYIALGAATHISVNSILYFLKIRKNI